MSIRTFFRRISVKASSEVSLFSIPQANQRMPMFNSSDLETIIICARVNKRNGIGRIYTYSDFTVNGYFVCMV